MISNKKYFVAPVNSSKANQFVSYYHYSHTGFKKSQLNLGIFDKETNLLVGVLQWGVSAQEGIRLDRYVKESITTNEYYELNRFAMADSEPKNSESQAISLGIKWIKQYKPEIKLLVSYAGRKEGNYGYIYQATNWDYLGYFVSNGFWIVNGEEKHQITLWNRYKLYANKDLGFKQGICSLFNEVVQTWTKQFIYVQLLDKKLTLASQKLPYPKPTNEYPICIKKEVYKSEPYDIINTYTAATPKFYFNADEPLFSRAALKRRGETDTKIYGVYSEEGELIKTYQTKIDIVKDYPTFSIPSITSHILNLKPYKGIYIREFINEEPAETIKIDYLCIINGQKFIRQVDVANYCAVSRQAVSSAVKRKASIIGGYKVEWKEN